MDVFGIDLSPLSGDTAHRLLASVLILVAVGLINGSLRWLVARLPDEGGKGRARFWGQQVSSIAAAIAAATLLFSLWVDDTKGMGTAVGLVSAGLAVASQKAVTSFLAYLVILRGKTLTVGDYVVIDGVRGKVHSVGFFQTTVFEMGESPAEQSAGPAVWVRGRQFTGRIVTFTNSLIFDSPVYNYTHDFPFVWEEMMLPVAYRDDRAKAERILLDGARKHALQPGEVESELRHGVERRYGLKRQDFEPRVYWHMTDNWLEMTARFLVRETEVRKTKDAITREVLAQLDAAGIGIASGTYEIVGVPPLDVRVNRPGTLAPGT